MNWLFEQPLAIVVLGVILLLVLGAAWSATGRKELVYALAATLALVLAGLAVERLVVTDREAIGAKLIEIARDVQSNNHRAVLRHVYSGNPSLTAKAEAELPKYTFTECRVTKILSIHVNSQAEPRKAAVEFNVVASGTFRADGFEVTDTVPRWVRLSMVKEKDGRWAVEEYEHDAPQRMLLDGGR